MSLSQLDASRVVNANLYFTEHRTDPWGTEGQEYRPAHEVFYLGYVDASYMLFSLALMYQHKRIERISELPMEEILVIRQSDGMWMYHGMEMNVRIFPGNSWITEGNVTIDRLNVQIEYGHLDDPWIGPLPLEPLHFLLRLPTILLWEG